MGEYSRLIIFGLVILFVPGYLLARLLFDKKEFSLWERIPIWFCLSLGILTIPGILAYIFNFTFSLLFIVLFSIAPLLLILNIIQKRKYLPQEANTSGKNPYFLSTIAILMGLALTGLAAWLGSYLEGDALNFLAFIRKLVENPFIVNRAAFYKEIVIDPIYGYNIWHLTLATLSRLSNVDPVRVWLLLPILLTPLIGLSFYTFAKTLFQNKEIALISVILFMLFYGLSDGLWVFRTPGYPTVVINLLILPLTLTFAFRYFRGNKTKYLILGSLLGFSIATIHLVGFTIFLLALASFYLFHLIFQKKDKRFRLRILQTFLLTILLASPYLIVRWPTFKIVNPYYLSMSFHDYSYFVEKLGRNLFYMNPKLLCGSHYLVSPPYYPRLIYLCAFLLTPFLLIYTTKKDWAVFLFSNMVVPPLIMLNPLLVPLLAKLITFDLVGRIAQLLPFLLVTGLFLSVCLFWIKKLFSKQKHLYYSLLAIILLLSLFTPVFNARFVKIFKEESHRFQPVFNKPGYLSLARYIHDNIKETSVILSDWQLSLFLPAYTKHFVVATYPGHASPATPNQVEREKDAKDAFDPEVGMDKTISILEKYGVGYIVLDLNRFPESPPKFVTNPEIFEEIYEENRIVIFKYLGREL